jgi:protein phosphatase
MNVDVEGEHGNIGLFVVSDGMGGKDYGELASKIVVKTIADLFLDSFLNTSLSRISEISNYQEKDSGHSSEAVSSPASFLAQSIQLANRRIRHLKKNGEPVKAGATVTAGILTDDLFTIGHVGDCRAYLAYDGSIRQLTQDHSVVNEMVKKGILTKEESQGHPQRNVLARALGSVDDVEVDTTVTVLQSGCKILLCSDGLYSRLENSVILESLSQDEHPKIISADLVNRANLAGGKDNITALIIHFL